MNKTLLRRFVRALVEGQTDPRIPTQLMSPKDAAEDDDTIDRKIDDRKDDHALDEFSSCGGGSIAGYSGQMGIPSVKKKRKPKK